MIASAVDTRKTGFFDLARRRNTELRLPAISRDGSSPSNGRLFSLGNTRTPDDRSSEWNNAGQPFRPVLVSGKEYDAVTAALPPLLEEMKRHHAERRRRGDRRTRRTPSLLQRAERRGLFWFFPRKVHRRFENRIGWEPTI